MSEKANLIYIKELKVSFFYLPYWVASGTFLATQTCGCSTTARAPAFQAGDAGSIPVIRSMQLKKLYYLSFFSPFLQSCARCILRRCIGHMTKTQYAGIAQSVEQLICNQQVGGSSPSTSSKYNRYIRKCVPVVFAYKVYMSIY